MSDQRTTTPAPIWQRILLIIMLLAFLAASYAFLRGEGASQHQELPPVLFLAEDETGIHQLFLIRDLEAQQQAIQLTTETNAILSYAPAPDGTQIAYTINLPDGSSQLKLLPLNNDGARQPQIRLSCVDAECSQPVWHPDSSRLVYERREPPTFNRPQLWWLDTETGEAILLLQEPRAVGSNARFSPDGNWVSFASSPNIGLRLYNFVDGRFLTFPSDVGTPATWHPLNNQFLYQNTRTVVFHGENSNNHNEHSHDYSFAVSLYLATINGASSESNNHLLSEDGVFNDGNAAWSPDGAWIAFGRRLAGTNTGRQLWLMRADGSEAHALTNDITVHYGPPSWSPDGRFLLFQQYNSTTPDTLPTVQLLEIATGDFIEVSRDGVLPTWLPH